MRHCLLPKDIAATLTIHQWLSGIRNTISMDPCTLRPSTKYAKRQIEYRQQWTSWQTRRQRWQGWRTNYRWRICWGAVRVHSSSNCVPCQRGQLYLIRRALVQIKTSGRYSCISWANSLTMLYLAFASSEKGWCSATKTWPSTRKQKTENPKYSTLTGDKNS